jgi:type IV pilus assembly protein PilN
MATINLLPWREERRDTLRKEFLALCALVAVAALICVGLASFAYSQAISAQEGRNAYLKSEISKLDEQVKEINELKAKKEKLQARMEVIQNLQRDRSVIVHLFDEMVNTLPDGVFFLKAERKANDIAVTGSAEANARISQLMRNLERSEWFESSSLTAVRQNPSLGEQGSDFDLNVKVAGFEDESAADTKGSKNSKAKKKK